VRPLAEQVTALARAVEIETGATARRSGPRASLVRLPRWTSLARESTDAKTSWRRLARLASATSPDDLSARMIYPSLYQPATWCQPRGGGWPSCRVVAVISEPPAVAVAHDAPTTRRVWELAFVMISSAAGRRRSAWC